MNRTVNYDLCQYEADDKTSYLVNYNNDMLKIDTAIKSADDAADAAQAKADTADGKADINAQSISTLNTQINGAQGIAADVSALEGSVNTINSLIGNGTPTTTDQTIIGAINELNAGKASVNDITDGYVYTEDVTISALNDGVKTYGTLVAEAVSSLATTLSALSADEYLTPNSVRVVGYCMPTNTSQRYISTSAAQIPYYAITGDLTALTITRGFLRANNPYHYVYGLTVADNTISAGDGLSDVATAPVELVLHKYKKVK